MQFKASIVAIITPMQQDGSLDQNALNQLIDWHIEQGTHGLVIAGTTGESATLSSEEHLALISAAVQHVNKRLPVIAGTGTNSTRTTISLCQQAKQAGADACLIVTPYYNKPTQQGLYMHYKTVAENTDLPIILYNVPGRTACDLLPETIERLASIPGIIGVKEASGKLERISEIQQRCGKEFAIYSGDDAIGLACILKGGHGVISVTANIAPKQMAAMCEAGLKGEIEKAEKINAELMPLHQHLFVESNPIPSKWALEKMGKIKGGIRLPLLPLDGKYHELVNSAMKHAGVI